MPFGKYKGSEISDVPRSYLAWVLENCDLYSDELREEIEDAVEGGSRGSAPPRNPWSGASGGTTTAPPPWVPKPPPVTPTPSQVDRVVRAWYRALVLKYHPDRGGAHDAMVAVNDAHELLKKLLSDEGVV